jgi:hypothetical protein
MRLRSRVHLAALSLLVAGAAACSDDSPVLTGDPYFPDGRPVTLEAIIPASEFLQPQWGTFTGYSTAHGVSYAVVANAFDGGVTARTLVRFEDAFPVELEYTQDAVARRDSFYTIVSARLVVAVDSAETAPGSVPLAAHRVTERWQGFRVNWTERYEDSTGVELWSTPGGTFEAAQAAAGGYFPADSASVAELSLSQEDATALREDSVHHGFLIESPQANTRLQLNSVSLRLELKPSNAVRDTTIISTVTSTDLAFIYTPEPPQPAGFWQAGTVRGARTLFQLSIPDSISVCAPTCQRIATKDVALHRVSLILRPRLAPGGYRLLDSAAVILRTATEFELGRNAPIGPDVVAALTPRGQPLPAREAFTPADSVVEIPFTLQAAQMINTDSVPATFALFGSTFDSLTGQPFSLLLFDPDPRLRIVFTLPERPRLP